MFLTRQGYNNENKQHAVVYKNYISRRTTWYENDQIKMYIYPFDWINIKKQKNGTYVPENAIMPAVKRPPNWNRK